MTEGCRSGIIRIQPKKNHGFRSIQYQTGSDLIPSLNLSEFKNFTTLNENPVASKLYFLIVEFSRENRKSFMFCLENPNMREYLVPVVSF